MLLRGWNEVNARMKRLARLLSDPEENVKVLECFKGLGCGPEHSRGGEQGHRSAVTSYPEVSK